MPFSTLGMNCRGTAPPTTRSTNSKPPPCGSGSTSICATAYCPCPPDCLTCRPSPAAGCPDGLPHRHPDRFDDDLDAGPIAKPVQQDVELLLAHGPHQQLLGRRVDLDPDGGILRLQPGEPLHELVLLARRPRRDRHRQQRFGHRPRRQHSGIGRIGERVAGLGMGKPGHRDDVAGDGLLDRGERGAQRTGDGAGPLVQIVLGVPGLVLGMTGEAGEMTADVHRDIRPQRAGEHPDDGHPADVRVGRRLDHLGDQWPVRAAGQRLPVLARRGVDRRQDVLDRCREAAADHLQQFRYAEPGGRHARQHRMERAAGDRRLQVVDDRVEADLLAAEVPVEQAVVLRLGDHRLDQRIPLGRRSRPARPRSPGGPSGCRPSCRRPSGTAARSAPTDAPPSPSGRYSG